MKKFILFLSTAALIISVATVSSCKKKPDPEPEPPPKPKTVKVETQTGNMRAGQPDEVTFNVTTENIANGDYDASMANMPTGVSVQGKVTIASNSGKLTLKGSATTTANTYSTLKLTISGATSPDFTLTIAAAINLTVSENAITFPILESNAQKTFDITSNAAWSIDIGAGSAWCEVSKTSGTGNEIIRLTTKSANDGYEDRSFTLKVTAGNIVKQIEVVQLYDPGNGTSNRPWKVYDVETLRKVGSGTGGWALSHHYKQMKDIDLSDEVNSWEPIGGAAAFTGNYNGDGYTISNLKINTAGDYKGLFRLIGVLGGVRNLAVTSVNISNGNSLIGGIAGANIGTIQNCYVTGSISGNNLVGGIVGYVTGNENIKVVNCYTTCNISSPATAGESYLGGVVGGIDGGALIQNCYATGNVINNRRVAVAGDFFRAGGVVGRCVAPSKLINCVGLNKEVRSFELPTNNSLAGRVCASISTGTEYTNCYGREGMTVTVAGISLDLHLYPALTTTQTMNGANLTPAIYNVAANWSNPTGANFPDTNWSFENNRLPHLKTTSGDDFKNPQNPTVQ